MPLDIVSVLDFRSLFDFSAVSGWLNASIVAVTLSLMLWAGLKTLESSASLPMKILWTAIVIAPFGFLAWWLFGPVEPKNA